jgi:DNA repair protein RadC
MTKHSKCFAQNKEHLLNLGLKEALLEKLDAELLSLMVSYAMDHASNANIAQNLISLASMEIRYKKGAIFLASNGIATVQQLKNISAEEIIKICELYKYSNDLDLASKAVLRALILEQQERLYNQTRGVKGEYFILRDEIEARDERFGG